MWKTRIMSYPSRPPPSPCGKQGSCPIHLDLRFWTHPYSASLPGERIPRRRHTNQPTTLGSYTWLQKKNTTGGVVVEDFSFFNSDIIWDEEWQQDHPESSPSSDFVVNANPQESQEAFLKGWKKKSIFVVPQKKVQKFGFLPNCFFQLDDSSSLHRKLLFHQTSTFKWLFRVPGVCVFSVSPCVPCQTPICIARCLGSSSVCLFGLRVSSVTQGGLIEQRKRTWPSNSSRDLFIPKLEVS